MNQNQIQKIINKIELSAKEKAILVFLNYYRPDGLKQIFNQEEIKKLIKLTSKDDFIEYNNWTNLIKMVQMWDAETDFRYFRFLNFLNEITPVISKYNEKKNVKKKIINDHFYSTTLNIRTTYSKICRHIFIELNDFMALSTCLMVNNYLLNDVFSIENSSAFKNLNSLSKLREHYQRLISKIEYTPDSYLKLIMINNFLILFFQKNIKKIISGYINHLESEFPSIIFLYPKQKADIEKKTIRKIYSYFQNLDIISKDQ